jgi:prepilin-type N-terminal cleavage/methylation domain-containing protein
VEEKTVTRRGFTLIELLMAVIITAIMMTVCFITFNTMVRCWQRSAAIADTVRNAEYALTQVVSGLRSAYYPTSGKQDYAYGFQLYDNGEDPQESDMIQWIKLGTSIVGNRSQLSETPHTVRVWVQEEGRDGPGGLWVKTGRLDLLADDPDVEVDFDDDEQFVPYLLIDGIQGFDCKVQEKPDAVETDGTPKWEDTWDASNTIPYRVKLTFWMTPTEKRGEPVPIMRVVELPLWDISQNPVTVSSEEDGGKGGKKGGSSSGGTGGGKGQTGGGRGPAGGGGRGPAGGGPAGGGGPPGGGGGR